MKNQEEKIFDELAAAEGSVDLIKNKNTNGKTYQGKEEKLGNYIFGYGHRSQEEFYNRTIEEIADFVGKKYSKEMRLLVKKGKEFAPEPPDDPQTDKEGKISEIDKLTVTSEYDNYKHEEKQYNQHKAKVAISINIGPMHGKYEKKD